jgi:ankyrin repeat protein
MGSTEKRSCPCKNLPLSLSSFTAAEYGDLATLSKLGPSVATRRDAGGYTPLHFSAQQNHVAACCLLLQLGCPVDGGGSCGATPLHRASFSGATATMKVLIEWVDRKGHDQRAAMLIARDTSFGDQATPLHKAAAGGRFLAVHLLLEALRETRSGSGGLSVLQTALEMRDAANRTPLDVARHYATLQDTEQRSVARWDEIAGEKADWDKVFQLLERAAFTVNNSSGNGNYESRTSLVDSQAESVDNTTSQSASAQTGSPSTNSALPHLPTHLIQDSISCLDCGFDNGGNCLTAKWEQDFVRALNKSANVTLDRPVTSPGSACSVPCVSPAKIAEQIKFDDKSDPASVATTRVRPPTAKKLSPSSDTAGAACGACQRSAVALYAQSDGTLVCKQCKKANFVRKPSPKILLA